MMRIQRSVVAFAVLAVFGAAYAPGIRAQNKFIYLNDNNSAAGGNTATSFQKSGITLLPPVHTGAVGTGYSSGSDALRQQALYFQNGAISCLFVSDPKPSTGFPLGDIATYVVNTTTGALTIPLRFASPFGANGFSSGIGLLVGGKVLYAAYTGTNTIVSWAIVPGTTGCVIKPALHITAVGAFGGSVHDMAFARLATSGTSNRVVATYGDGSLQSFKVTGFALAPDCAAPTNFLGHVNQGSLPWGVDATQDGKHAVFAAANNSFAPTEMGSVAVPITCTTPTVDFGGAAIASGVNLGAGADAQNLWISPQEQFIYVNDVLTGQITSVTFVAGTGTVTGLAAPCAFNPTPPLRNYLTTWTYPAGIGTAATTGTGNFIYVAETGNPSSVALLSVSTTGCLTEAPASPFFDPVSIFAGGIDGLTTLSALPPRPF